MGADALVIVVILLLWLVVLAVPIALAVLIAVLWSRLTTLQQKVEQLEGRLRALALQAGEESPRRMGAKPTDVEQPVVTAEPAAGEAVEPAEQPEPALPVSGPPFDWELFLGRKALGWASVVLLLFGTAFFLRYAFDHDWIGPLGQVTIGLLAGIAFSIYGWRYHRHGWPLFSQMLTAAGIVLMYLSIYAAFGFYQLLPQQAAALFLLVVVVQSALLAVLYQASALAHMALVGGLLTPQLLPAEHDQYVALFTYLAILNAGVLFLAVWRHWAGLATVALLGTHALYWLWYAGHYHPEKLSWAWGFQTAVYGLFLGHALVAHVWQPRRATVEDLSRMVLVAFLWFLSAYVLLERDYAVWQGTLAVVMAAVYVGMGRVTLGWRSNDVRQTLVAVGIGVAFLTLAIPIQAEAHWIALGWAALGAALWWFGLRVNMPALRVMAIVVGILAVVRVVLFDTPWHIREPFWPIFNRYGLPALGVSACVLGSVVITRRFRDRLGAAERPWVGIAGGVGVLLLWLVLSFETYGYFAAYGEVFLDERERWRWLGQMALSVLWAAYATGLLALGFWKDLAPLRWAGLAFFTLTIGKVFLVDMAELRELYRILAFLVVAVLAGFGARVYQRMRPETTEEQRP